MNKKVSSIQIGMLFFLFACSLYLGLSDIILLKKSLNDVLISMLVGTILGLIPIIMYLKVNDTYPDLDFYDKTKKMFGKVIGSIINIIMFIIYLVMLVIAVRTIVVFVASKYLQTTPFYVIGLLAIATILVINFKGLETIARVSQINFIIAIILIIIIEVFLLQYIKIDNLFPMFTKNVFNHIASGSIYYAGSTSMLCLLLLCIKKDEIRDPKKYNKTIIISYIIASLSLVVVMFFIISCFGYNLATLFRYPEYIILKKISLSNTDLHIENLLAFRWLFYALSLGNISLLGITRGINKLVKKEKISNIITIFICLLSVFLARNILGHIPHSILIIEKYYIPFIALPMLIILGLLFIKSIFAVEKKNG